MADTLVGVDILAAHLDDPAWCVFDCRHDLKNLAYGEQSFAQGHIPGAQFLHLDRDLSGAPTGTNGRHPLPDSDAFAARMSACGIGPDTQVVAYDNEGGVFAARLWWLLRWLGHDKVAVLDGGLAAWRRAKLPQGSAVRSGAAARFVPRPRDGVKVDAAHVLARLHAPDMILIDARSPDRYAGENETLDPVGGHIPGALNRCFADNLDASGCFKPPAALRAEFADILDGRDARSVVLQCGSGVTACHNQLAMEIAGLPGARLYPGSWSEWCSDPSRPVAKGDQPG